MDISRHTQIPQQSPQASKTPTGVCGASTLKVSWRSDHHGGRGLSVGRKLSTCVEICFSFEMSNHHNRARVLRGAVLATGSAPLWLQRRSKSVTIQSVGQSISYPCRTHVGEEPCARQQQKRQLCVHLLVGSITWQVHDTRPVVRIEPKYGALSQEVSHPVMVAAEGERCSVSELDILKKSIRATTFFFP